MGEEKKSIKEYLGEKLDDILDTSEPIIHTAGKLASVTLSTIETSVPVIVPITKFFPLISEIGNVLNEIVEIVQAAEHNKRICDVLLQKVYAAELAVHDLKVRRNVHQGCFNTKNYLGLQSLCNVISQIKKFTGEVSQMKTMMKYLKGKSIEKTFKELCREFDSCVSLLSFTIAVKDRIDEAEQLRADQEELNKYIEEMGIEVKEIGADVKQVKTDVKEIGNDVKELVTEIKQIKQITENYPDMVLKITAMNTTMEKLSKHSEPQTKIDNLFQVHNLNFKDYVQGDEKRDGGQVTKWTYKHQEFAFKVIGEGENDVQNQVTILKEFQDWQNIIKFYGLTNDGSTTYLVTEWAEFGNLREFYTSCRDRFEVLKLKFSLDIARGLNFLRTVEIVHRDVRAENIFITINEVAKLGNFKSSRPLTGPTKKQNQNLERVRYCAPELLERAQNFKYNHKCEVYSFGILLWEISEARIPYANHDIMTITNLILKKKYREPFSENNGMSEKFKELVTIAVSPDPDFRPKLSKMVNILGECNKEYVRLSHTFSPSSSKDSQSQPKIPTPKRTFSIDNDYEFAIKDEDLQDFESFNYMTLAEAERQHKLVDKTGKLVGDLKNAYKCFEAYAKLNQVKAKYYKAYYISKGYDDLDLSAKDKERMIAELFKEVADDEANEFPEAKLRYGDCLYHGKGVEQNFTEALKYFESAAEDGLRVAMYNVGNLYYKGCNCKKDEAKAISYMKLAAYNEYNPAIAFCKEHNIKL